MEFAIYSLAEACSEYDVDRLRARLSTMHIAKWRGYWKLKAALESQAIEKMRMRHG